MSTLDEFFHTVKQFNETFRKEKGFSLGLDMCLILEEMGELAESELKHKGQEHSAREWADVLFVLLGYGINAGFDLDAAMNYVMVKNQLKIDRASTLKVSPAGKILKPEDSQ